jgi:glycerol-3-phosphate dehydrogenase (NAD(P)+)
MTQRRDLPITLQHTLRYADASTHGLAVLRELVSVATGYGASKGDIFMEKIAVIGSGAWGTTLARLVALEEIRKAQSGGPDCGKEIAEVTLWEHLPERAAQMQWGRENQRYLPGFPLPANIRVTADVVDAVRGRDIVLIVTPAQRVRENIRALAPALQPGAILVCGSKGIELGTHLRMTEVMEQEAPAGTVAAILSGPNLAAEIARGLPAAAVVASRDPEAAEKVRAALSTSTFRLYTSEDVAGVELGGALKNIIAIGIGISDGLQYGDNAKASLMTRALTEIARLALAAGANPLTLAGLSGLGDLIATCSSPLSRNRALGLELAKGREVDEVLAERRTVAEGVTTTRAALQMAEHLGVELPVTAEIARVLFEGKSVREAVRSLMIRDPKRELAGFDEQ